MTLNRREMLRLGAMGAAGAMLSSAASSSVLPSVLAPTTPLPRIRRSSGSCHATHGAFGTGRHRSAVVRPGQGGARFAPDRCARLRSASSTSPSRRTSRASTSSTCVAARSDSHRVAHGRGSDPDHSGFVERFSNDFGSHATSNGTYTTADYYRGQVRAFDEGPRTRLEQLQRRAARDRHPQRVVRRDDMIPHSRQARPLGRLLRLLARRASGRSCASLPAAA